MTAPSSVTPSPPAVVVPIEVDPAARFARFITRLVALYPVLWLIGLAPAFWVVVGVAAVRYLVRTRLSLDARIVLLVPVLLLASLPVGLIRFGADPGRVVSLIANLCIWVGAAAVVNAVSPRADRTTALARAFVGLGVVQGLLIAVSAALYPTRLPVPLLAPLLAGAPTGISTFATNGLFYADWLNGAAFRSQGIMGNATWNGAVGAITLLLGLAGVLRWRGQWRLLAVLGVVAGLISLQTSLSRSTSIALAAAVVGAIWVALKGRWPGAWLWVTAAAVVAGVWVVGAHLGVVVQQVQSINAERAGSAESRGEIYATTLRLIRESPFPAIGYGLKPKEDGLVASVATHSTYLGIVFRAGFLGAAALLVVFLRGLLGAVRRSRPLATALMVFIVLWCVFEDFDGGHLVPLALAFVFAAPRSEPHAGADTPPPH